MCRPEAEMTRCRARRKIETAGISAVDIAPDCSGDPSQLLDAGLTAMRDTLHDFPGNSRTGNSHAELVRLAIEIIWLKRLAHHGPGRGRTPRPARRRRPPRMRGSRASPRVPAGDDLAARSRRFEHDESTFALLSKVASVLLR